ncbi:hypothetical protein [Amycolatopsis sp. CA-230715]|uniref:hypothetical protein n=1 Tax=Amycolatopsis sp. CA-230715 TaxID=2745196 RepID=UPI001C336FDE|nr:hypothetical protein [Amycolatopsis sp. CA-230715]QWF81088.1 hypothetical protein HUW46_04514 [Amycolatopsis sp. CA-230715]
MTETALTDLTLSAARRRALEVRKRLARFKLVFIQCGVAFEPLREPLLAQLDTTVLDAADFAKKPGLIGPGAKQVVLTGVEAFARDGTAAGTTIGTLRVQVLQLLERDIEVCLVSRVARTAFAPVVGSNLLVDAKLHCLPALGSDECPATTRDHPGFALPAIGFGSDTDVATILRTALAELGVSILTELDYALFEARHNTRFISEVDAVTQETLRSAGLAHIVNDEISLTAPRLLWKFKEAIGDVMASNVSPQTDLAEVSEGLWNIERTIRKTLRDAAVNEPNVKNWRKSLLHETLAKTVLERARDDAHPDAASIAELRDPIEWLSLGELLELVRSKRFDGLFWKKVTWDKFTQQVIPIRNRLSHMRLLKKGDKTTVRKWVNLLQQAKK